MRIFPSERKGIVTMPMTSAPSSFARRATYCAAPVPVPPPIPAVMNVTCDPWRNSRISSSLSWAACSPTSGSAPAPRPFVRRFPMRIFFGAWTARRCFASVLTAQSCAPVIPASEHRLTVFEPPPPQPTILIETFRDSTILAISSSASAFGGGAFAAGTSFARDSSCRARAWLTIDLTMSIPSRWILTAAAMGISLFKDSHTDVRRRRLEWRTA